MKKARALLRLGAGRHRPRAGRALSTVRGAAVGLRAALVARHDACLARAGEEETRAADAVAGALVHASAIAPEHHGFRALAGGLDRAYRRAHERATRAAGVRVPRRARSGTTRSRASTDAAFCLNGAATLPTGHLPARHRP